MTNVTNEEFLTRLGYNVNEGSLKELELVKQNTGEFEKIAKHIIDLHEHLKTMNAFIAISSTKPYLKIKNEEDKVEAIDFVNDYIKKWAEKYKVTLQKVENKNTYYIIGFHH
ncbi:MAG: hypothetical protein HXX81_02270 [Campylobacterales bacterium]|nr:hypothetical protein [Campylobacterales bacterium]